MVTPVVTAGPYRGDAAVQAPRGTIIVSPKTGWVEDGAYAAPAGSGTSSTLRMPPPWAIAAGMRHACLNIGITELVDVSPLGVVTPRDANLDAILAPAYAWNATCPPGQQVTVDVRFQVGERAPDYWKTQCGTVQLSDGSFGKNAAVPRWHVPAYLPLFENAWAVIGPMMDARAIIGSVNNPMAAPFYPEVFLLFGNSVVEDRPAPEPDITNEMNLVAAGWTPALQRGFMRAAVNIPAKYTSRVVVYLAINPTIFPTESSWDQAFMWEIVDAHIASLPPWRAGVENYSARMSYMTGTGNYQTMYAGICARPCWRSIQLARAHRVADTQNGDTYTGWPEVAMWWANLGGHAVETPGPTVTGGAANGWPTSFQNRVTDMTASDTVLTAKANVRRDRA